MRSRAGQVRSVPAWTDHLTNLATDWKFTKP